MVNHVQEVVSPSTNSSQPVRNITLVTRNGQSAEEISVDIFLMTILVLSAMIMAILLAYTGSKVMSRLYDAVWGNSNASSQEDHLTVMPVIFNISHQASAAWAVGVPALQDIGTISRKAHLWGLRGDERETILHCFFLEHIRVLSPSDPEVLLSTSMSGDLTLEDAETGQVDALKAVQPIDSNELGLQELRSVSNVEAPMLNDDVSTKKAQISDTSRDTSVVSTTELGDCEGMCSICLLSYEAGDSVMTGTQCHHMFHFDCCQAWLAQHDHCPYCRRDMLRPVEFRQAAVLALGERRVEQLTRQDPNRRYNTPLWSRRSSRSLSIESTASSMRNSTTSSLNNNNNRASSSSVPDPSDFFTPPPRILPEASEDSRN